MSEHKQILAEIRAGDSGTVALLVKLIDAEIELLRNDMETCAVEAAAGYQGQIKSLRKLRKRLAA